MVEFDQEDAFMKTDETKPGVASAACEGDSQNRREFFNGLGKWSMVVVAAVAGLGRAGETHAKKPQPHHVHQESTSWGDNPHTKYPKYAKITKEPPSRVQPGGGKSSVPPPAKMYE
jgi:hypothetical protein